MHAVRARAGERQIDVAVAVKVCPLRAMVRLEPDVEVRGHVLEARAGIPIQVVAIARATGDRAVHVEVEPSVVVEILERTGVVTGIDVDPPDGDASSNCPRRG